MEPAAPTTTSFRASDLDEARVICGDFFVPRSMRLLDRSAQLAARFDIMHAGAVTVGDVEYGAEITGRCEDLAAYHMNIPLAGGFHVRQDRREVEASVTTASVFRPSGALALERASSDCRMLTVQIDRHALEGHLEELLDAPVRGPLRMPIGLDLTAGGGRAWAGVVRTFAAAITDAEALVHHPRMAVPLRDTLLTATLFAVAHQYRDALDQIGLAGVSPARFLSGVRGRCGSTPVGDLWESRLSHAHDELRQAHPRTTSVRAVAVRWGFPYLTRFVAAYRARYHVSPSQTLHGPACNGARTAGGWMP